LFFLPAFAYLVYIMAMGMFILKYWPDVKANGLGDRIIYIPLFVIVAGIGISGFVNGDSLQDKIAPLGMGMFLFVTYIVARILGGQLFTPIVIVSMVAVVGIIARNIVVPGVPCGGYVFENNYDIATGYVAFAALVARGRFQWILIGVALVGLFFTGAPEAIVVIAIVGLAVLIRRDWSWKLGVVLGSLAVIALAAFSTGAAYQLYQYTITTAQSVLAHYTGGEPVPLIAPLPSFGDANTLTGYWGRIPVIERAMANLAVFGHGYAVTAFTSSTVHNVPLIIVDQIGIIPALAWVSATIYLVWKTSWKYAWIGMLAFGIFDHFTWTQLAPYWWVLAGVSTMALTESKDYIFKKCEA
jgi:hypothetical protein